MYHVGYLLLILAAPKSLDPVDMICKGTTESYDDCYYDERQSFLFDNLFQFPLSIYYAKVLFKWACMAKEKGKATDEAAA